VREGCPDLTSQNEHSQLKHGETIMKLPIQSRPIVRGISSARISHALTSGINASDCNSEWLQLNQPIRNIKGGKI
jgi:hypothetical protein